jgi:signal transduction histidine kinase
MGDGRVAGARHRLAGRAAGVPLLLLGAAAGSCAELLREALDGRDVGWILLVLPVVAFLAGRAPAWLAGTGAIALLFAGMTASQFIHYDDDSVAPLFMLPTTLYLAGLALRNREALASRLTAQSAELEEERDTYARLSVRYERARIAAELHDVVAHAISVMVVQAGAGQRLATREPARTSETFGIIAAAARQAQADLERLADLLSRDAGAAGATADLGLIREIIDTAAASGFAVTLVACGDTSGVPGPVAHVTLRIVQEGLTNALRYAPGAAVEVTLKAGPGAVKVEVSNDRPTGPPRLGLGSGRGLAGLRERAGACGGQVHAGPDADGGWALSAQIPY